MANKKNEAELTRKICAKEKALLELTIKQDKLNTDLEKIKKQIADIQKELSELRKRR